MKLDCSYTCVSLALFISAICIAILALSAQQYRSALNDIVPTHANVTKTDISAPKWWLVLVNYNFTALDRNTYSGADYKMFYTFDGAKEFAASKTIDVFYYKSRPSVNGIAYFLDLTWWIVAIVTFSILNVIAVPVFFVSCYCLWRNIEHDSCSSDNCSCCRGDGDGKCCRACFPCCSTHFSSRTIACDHPVTEVAQKETGEQRNDEKQADAAEKEKAAKTEARAAWSLSQIRDLAPKTQTDHETNHEKTLQHVSGRQYVTKKHRKRAQAGVMSASDEENTRSSNLQTKSEQDNNSLDETTSTLEAKSEKESYENSRNEESSDETSSTPRHKIANLSGSTSSLSSLSFTSSFSTLTYSQDTDDSQ